MAFDTYTDLQAEISDYLARDDLAAKIRHCNCRLRGMNIKRNHRTLMIQFKKGRPSPTRRSSRRTFEYPPLLNQIFDNQ